MNIGRERAVYRTIPASSLARTAENYVNINWDLSSVTESTDTSGKGCFQKKKILGKISLFSFVKRIVPNRWCVTLRHTAEIYTYANPSRVVVLNIVTNS